MNQKNKPQGLVGKALVFLGISIVAGLGALKSAGKGVGRNSDDVFRIAGKSYAAQERYSHLRSSAPQGKFKPGTLGNLHPPIADTPVDSSGSSKVDSIDPYELVRRMAKTASAKRADQEAKKAGSASATQDYWDLVIAKHYLYRFGNPTPPPGIEWEDHLGSVVEKMRVIANERSRVSTRNVDQQLIEYGEKLKDFDNYSSDVYLQLSKSYQNLPPREQAIADRQLKEDAKQKLERGSRFLEDLSEEQLSSMPQEAKKYVRALMLLSDWSDQLHTDLEILQITLEERFRGTSFDLPENPYLTGVDYVRWPVGGNTPPANQKETERIWKSIIVPARSVLERCVETADRAALIRYLSTLQIEQTPQLENVDEQLVDMVNQHLEIESQIFELLANGIQIAKTELGVVGENWLERLSQMPAGKLPKVDVFNEKLSLLVERQAEIFWKSRYLRAILEERYPDADFSLPRLVLADESKWVGTCTEPGKEPYPMILIVKVGADGKLIGTLFWPKLTESVTRLSGEVQGNLVSFTESQLLAGFGVGLPCQYEAVLSEDRLTGTATFNDRKATFSLRLETGELSRFSRRIE